MPLAGLPWPWIRAHALDLILGAALLLELVAGYRAGLLLTAAGTGGRIVAAAVAWTASPALLRLPWVARQVPAVALWMEHLAAARQVPLGTAGAAAAAAGAFRVAAILLLYLVITRAIMAAAGAMTDLVRGVPVLGAANRLGGAALGIAVCAVELGLLCALALTLAGDLHASGTQAFLERSWLVSHLDGAAERAVAAALGRWQAGAAAAAARLHPVA